MTEILEKSGNFVRGKKVVTLSFTEFHLTDKNGLIAASPSRGSNWQAFQNCNIFSNLKAHHKLVRCIYVFVCR